MQWLVGPLQLSLPPTPAQTSSYATGNITFVAVKRSIPRGCRNNYRPCWDAGYERLYQAFLRASLSKASSTAASALLARLDDKRRERWSEAVNTIDFTHLTT